MVGVQFADTILQRTFASDTKAEWKKNILVSGNIEGGMGIYNTFLEFQDHELCSKYIQFYSWLLDNKRLQLKTTDFPKLA